MREKKNYKLGATVILSILLANCGGGGGGGGSSSNLPIKPTNIEKEIKNSLNNKVNNVKKDIKEELKKEIDDKKESLKNKEEAKKKEIEKEVDNEKESLENKIEEKIKDAKNTFEIKDSAENNLKNNEQEEVEKEIKNEEKILEKIDYEKIKNELGVEKLKQELLNARKDSKEAIPSDERQLNGSTQKVALMDSEFVKDKVRLENKFNDLEILERDPRNQGVNKRDHGELVLAVIKNQDKLKVIAGSIGKAGDTGEVKPSAALYEKAFEKFGDQKVKIFNQSWGTGKTVEEFKGMEERKKIATLAPGYKDIDEAYEEGKKILDFYKKAATKDGLFVWAAGNKGEENSFMSDASLQAGLPYFYSYLERSWISVVGVDAERDGTLNIERAGGNRLAWAGDAAWWSISADVKSVGKSNRAGVIEYRVGSSYAAPKVTRAAALVAEKFPWMTANQVRQTLFTTTDKMEILKTEENKRNIISNPIDSVYGTKYGWGMLNTERALKGPGAFINTLRTYRDSSDLNNVFEANIPENQVVYFENDIYGDGGLKKLGKGTLHLTGNNSYRKGSTIKEGNLEVHKIHAGNIEVEKDGKLTLHSRSLIGYQSNAFAVIDEKEISPDNIISKNVDNYGKVEVVTNVSTVLNKKAEGTAIIGGDYNAYEGSVTEIDFNSKVAVLGKVNMNAKSELKVKANGYIPKAGLNETLIEANEIVNVGKVSTNGMKEIKSEIKDGNLTVSIARKDASDYINENGSLKDVAENVDKVLNNVDNKISSAILSEEELVMAKTIQNMSKDEFLKSSEKMSGEIYASSQALTLAQAQNINRDLSNRIAGLDNLNNSDRDSQVWVSGIGSHGKLKKDGYATADTKVIGGQFGVDKKINEDTHLGLALAYSNAKAEYNRYAGNADSDMVGFSLYGRKDLKNNFYTAGRVGLSHISTKVQRELIDANGNIVQGKINHKDFMTSFYMELGKKIKNITPYVAYSNDYLKRGKFSESDAAWGIQADSKNYWATNITAGLRYEKSFDKNKIQAYIAHSINIGKRDLSYEGNFTGSKTKLKFNGIGQAKNTTWIGLGLFREINQDFGIYGNIDFRIEDGKKADSMFSTGLQYKF